jgi:hypothetical protein
MIRRFQQDASWFKARWRAEMPRCGRKQLGAAPPAKRRCVIAFIEQNAKAIFRKMLTRPIWPVT